MGLAIMLGLSMMPLIFWGVVKFCDDLEKRKKQKKRKYQNKNVTMEDYFNE